MLDTVINTRVMELLPQIATPVVRLHLLVVDADAGRDQAHMQQLVLELPRIKQHIGEATVRKVIVVPGKLVNIVAN